MHSLPGPQTSSHTLRPLQQLLDFIRSWWSNAFPRENFDDIVAVHGYRNAGRDRSFQYARCFVAFADHLKTERLPLTPLFLLSDRSSTPVSQVAHLHDFVDRENDVHFDGLGTVLVPRLHRFAANEGFRILGNKDWIASIQRHDSLWIVRIKRVLVGLEEVRDFLVDTFRWFRFRGDWFRRVLWTARGSVRDGQA